MNYFIGIEDIRHKLNVSHMKVDDNLLSIYRETAIDLTMDLLNRTERDLIDSYDGVPDKINEAITIMVRVMIEKGDLLTAPKIYEVPYEYDENVKEYMNLESKQLTAEQKKAQEEAKRLQEEIEAKGRILGLDYIKQHMRINFDDDKALDEAALKAQQFVLKYIGRSFGGLKTEYGEIPKNIIFATLIVTEWFYLHRDKGHKTDFPYTFKIMLKPYKRKR